MFAPFFARHRLAALLLFATLLSALWATATPPPVLGVAASSAWGNFHPDETSHIAVVRFMAAHPGTLPPYHYPYDTSVHPPLYHGAAALLARLAEPIFGATGAARVIRLFSAALGAGTVYLVYRAARETRLARSSAFVAAALVALVPMRVSLSGAVTNENLAAFGAAGALAALYAAIRRGFTPRRWAVLSGWCVVALGSKITCAGLIPAVILGAALSARGRGEPFGRVLAGTAALLTACLAFWGWWFAYNTVHYGDPLRKAAADVLWNPVQPGYAVIHLQKHFAPWHYLVSILSNGWISFWGIFDGFKHRFPTPFYLVFAVGQSVAAWGLTARLRRLLPRSSAERTIWATTGVFTAFVTAVYCQYNWAHYTPQGRYFFVLLAPFGALMAGGFDAALRRIPASRRARAAVYAVVGTLLLAANLYALVVMPRRL